MKGMLLLLVMLVTGAAYAVEAGQVAYVDGSLKVAGGTLGRLDTTGDDRLVFRYEAGGKAGETAMVYSKVQSVRAEVMLARHLGFAPAVAVGMVRHRERKHYLLLTYADSAGVAQVARFEIAKGQTEPLLTLLRVRAPQACGEKDGCVEKDVTDAN